MGLIEYHKREPLMGLIEYDKRETIDGIERI